MTSSEVILDKKYWYKHIVETGDVRNIYFWNRGWMSMKIEGFKVLLGHFYGKIWRNAVTMTSYNVNMTSLEVILDKKYWYNHIIESGVLRNVFFRNRRWTNLKIDGSNVFLGHFYGKLWRNAILMNYHDVIGYDVTLTYLRKPSISTNIVFRVRGWGAASLVAGQALQMLRFRLK